MGARVVGIGAKLEVRGARAGGSGAWCWAGGVGLGAAICAALKKGAGFPLAVVRLGAEVVARVGVGSHGPTAVSDMDCTGVAPVVVRVVLTVCWAMEGSEAEGWAAAPQACRIGMQINI